jgi:hypothetical protein
VRIYHHNSVSITEIRAQLGPIRTNRALFHNMKSSIHPMVLTAHSGLTFTKSLTLAFTSQLHKCEGVTVFPHNSALTRRYSVTECDTHSEVWIRSNIVNIRSLYTPCRCDLANSPYYIGSSTVYYCGWTHKLLKKYPFKYIYLILKFSVTLSVWRWLFCKF